MTTSMRPRLLLVPEFTELTWTIRPRLEEWAEVATYDPPGVGEEPLPDEADPLTPEVVVAWPEWTAQRGLDEIDRLGWDRFFLVADGFTIGAATRIAEANPDSVAGMALGHARLSNRRHGERAPISDAVWQGLTQLLGQDHEAFIRHAIAQATGGSFDEDLASRMLERFPKPLIVSGWESLTADEPFGESLNRLGCPLLLAKHQGCLMSTDEGFEDAIARLTDADTVSVPEAPCTSPGFADALRKFCTRVVGQER